MDVAGNFSGWSAPKTLVNEESAGEEAEGCHAARTSQLSGWPFVIGALLALDRIGPRTRRHARIAR
jgi:hypothetical protein